ncbi:MAG: hypothetical protein IT548_19770 [Alphaproteobacteria bacterium]|nr:hypothetical protein [Alphaproteobacteria bacterium]
MLLLADMAPFWRGDPDPCEYRRPEVRRHIPDGRRLALAAAGVGVIVKAAASARRTGIAGIIVARTIAGLLAGPSQEFREPRMAYLVQ